MRASGILMPVFSLPGPYGIGTLGDEAFAFVDFLAAAKQTYWQILPIGPTGYGDSPYQSFSAFAGNPYFIDFRLLAADGLLTEAELPAPQLQTEEIIHKLLYKCTYFHVRFHIDFGNLETCIFQHGLHAEQVGMSRTP